MNHICSNSRSASVISSVLFFLLTPPPPRSTLFPYTTLFRSGDVELAGHPTDLGGQGEVAAGQRADVVALQRDRDVGVAQRSEEHTSELQSRRDLVCRLLLEKKKKPGNMGDLKSILLVTAKYG